METRRASANEYQKLLKLTEDHFNDVKSKRIKPQKLQETFVAFANSDGGDLYIGVEDEKIQSERVVGFDNIEDANGIINTLLEETQPTVENVFLEFIDFNDKGFVLHLSIPKSPKVHYTAQGDCFIRVNAGKRKITGERITQLAYSKGAYQYEKVAVEELDLEELTDSHLLEFYMRRIGTNLSQEKFLRKQRLLTKKDDIYYPNVGCVLLFDEEPQATLSTRCAVKIYRLRTTENDYKREHLAEMPTTINGAVEKVIEQSLNKITELLDGASFHDGEKLVKLSYPAEAIKEILVNAVIHRDYSLNDDIHIKIFDNRIEIQSPGKLPGYMTLENLYEERYSRNPNLVRMLHNLPNPVNHDIGEGLDTAKNELKKAGLIAPVFYEKGSAFVVVVKHQKLASVEDVVLEFLKENPSNTITNKIARQLSGEDDVNKVKKAFQKLRKENLIELVDPNANVFDYKYKLVNQADS